MSNALRIGLVGCGGMGNEHLGIVRSAMTGAQLVGVCDYRADRAERMGRQHGVAYWTDFTKFLHEACLDVLHICSPTGYHDAQGIEAANAGVHVLCEKPLDLDLSRIDNLIAACDKNNVRLGCIFQRRAVRGAQEVQRAIAAGEMGRILSCSVSIKWWRSQEYYDKDDWRGTRSLDGGALANQGIHSLDQMVWMAGPVEAVEFAHLDTVSHDLEVEDFAIVVVRFTSGARGVIEATTCCKPDLSTRLEIFGTQGSAALDDAFVVRFGLDGEDRLNTLPDRGKLMGGGSDPWAISLAGHTEQIRDFYSAVIEHREPMVDGRAARVSVDLLDKIYRHASK